MNVISHLRNGVYEHLENAKPTLSITDFDLERTYFPEYKLAEATKPLVSVVGQSFAMDRLTRGGRCNTDTRKDATVPVTVGIHAKIDPNDLAGIDLLVDFYEEIQDNVAAVNVDGFLWSNTQPLRDDAGQPFAFVVFREEHVFQAIFYAYFKAILV